MWPRAGSARRSLSVLLVLLAPVGACAGPARGPRVGAAPPPEVPRPELLRTAGQAVWAGDLATARQALATLGERETGRPDSELDFWSELLAMLDCRGLASPPRVGRPLQDPWDQLRRLVQLERSRMGREEIQQNGPGDPPRQSGALEISWPRDNERWSDERPLGVRASAGCPDAEQMPGGKLPGAAEIAAVLSAAQGLRPEHPARVILLLDAAVMEIQRGKTAEAGLPLKLIEQQPAAIQTLTPPERAQLALSAALNAEVNGELKPEQIVERLRGALAQDLPAPVRRGLQLRLSERLRAIGRAEDAVQVLGPPSHGEDEVGRYMAFRQAEAHARAGRRAEVLAEARAALGKLDRAAVERTPALAALMDIALRTLLASPVSAETLEVLESLGNPRERMARAEAFARLALSSSAYDSAARTFTWLYDNERDPNRQLQHLARAAVAAARAGDRQQFSTSFKLLAGQEDLEPRSQPPRRMGEPSLAERRKEMAGKPGELIASSDAERSRGQRRAARSANWQRALLVVARDAVPWLVEHDDQANLAILVDVLQRHLDAGGRGPVDNELTTLYRAASAHLKAGARAYAENVGANRRPIFLGEIVLDRKYSVSTPRVEILPEAPRPLLFVPRNPDDPSTMVRWPGRPGTRWKGPQA